MSARKKMALRILPWLLVPALLAACSSPPTTDAGSSASKPARGKEGLDAVYAALKGLDLQARRQKLIELAKKEGGSLTIYAATNPTDLKADADAFEASTGIKVRTYSNSSDVVARVKQESQANASGADIAYDATPNMALLEQDNLLLPLSSPLADQLTSFARDPNGKWLAADAYLYMVAWNTKLVGAGKAPTTYEDIFRNHQGQIGIDSRDWPWFATLVEDYFVAKKGMTEQAAIDLVRQGVRGATIVTDHTLGAQLMAAGKFGVYAVMYYHYLERFPGAPIGWEPAVQPFIAGRAGLGIVSNTDNPAGALLLTEWFLSDGQKVLLDQNRLPLNTQYQPKELSQIETIPLRDDLSLDPAAEKKWNGIWTSIVESAGTKPING